MAIYNLDTDHEFKCITLHTTEPQKSVTPSPKSPLRSKMVSIDYVQENMDARSICLASL